jgi:hypothetical protein
VNRPIPALKEGDFINQEHTLTSALAEAIRTVLDYLWEAEHADFESDPRPSHIFPALQTLAEAVQKPGKPAKFCSVLEASH